MQTIQNPLETPEQSRRFLRQLRKAQGLTLEQAAQKAGIGRVTLNRWETGAQKPRLKELEALLGALEVGPAQRRKALALAECLPQVQRVAMIQAAQAQEIGPMPHGGDLLRAMRLRQGLGLEAVSARLGVTARTLRRWEQGEVWPSVKQRHALCFALGAREEEIVALTYGRFSEGFLAEKVSLETLEERVKLQWGTASFSPQFELHLLALEAQIWPLAARGVPGRILLARTYTIHADLLAARERLRESGAYAHRALDLLPEKASSEWCGLFAGILAAHAAVYGPARPMPRRGLEMLRYWLPATQPPEQEAWIVSRMAEYLALDGAMEAGLSLAETACQVAARCEEPRELRRRQTDRAGLLLRAGRPQEALPLLTIESEDDPDRRTFVSLKRVATYLTLGETAVAHDWLQRALTDIETYDLIHRRNWAETLAQRF